VIDVGPTFWFGAALKDSHSLDSQAFEELQFYPDSTLAASGCASNGGFTVTSTPNKYTVCSPVWAVNPSSFVEYAAFNGMVTTTGSTTQPFVMTGGDSITVHYFKGTQTGAPFNITVTDNTTSTSATTLVLDAGTGKSDPDGTLSPLAGANTTSNFMKWGAVQQAPLSLSWEIGHPNIYKYNVSECVPGQAFDCYSYNVTNGWLPITPLRITSAQLNNKTANPTSWTTTDSQGGSAEDVRWCGSYNAAGSGGSCTFPWYTYNGTASAIEFGGSFTGTTDAYNTYHQFATTTLCSGGTIYCATTLSPKPPIP